MMTLKVGWEEAMEVQFKNKERGDQFFKGVTAKNRIKEIQKLMAAGEATYEEEVENVDPATSSN